MKIHYTRIENLNKILTSERGPVFHLSDCRLVNDPSEMEIFKQYLFYNSKHISSHLTSDHDIMVFNNMINRYESICKKNRWMFGLSFILSTTSRYDSALYWNSKYASPTGLGIVMCSDKMLEFGDDVEYGDRYRKVSYIDYEQSDDTLNCKIAKRITEFIQYQRNKTKQEFSPDDEDILFVCLVLEEGPFYKHISWEHEHEWRLVIEKGVTEKHSINEPLLRIDSKNIYEESTAYKTVNGSLVPYVEMVLPKEIITRIVLGPANNEVNKEIIENYLYKSGYDNIDVQISRCPIRSVG